MKARYHHYRPTIDAPHGTPALLLDRETADQLGAVTAGTTLRLTIDGDGRTATIERVVHYDPFYAPAEAPGTCVALLLTGSLDDVGGDIRRVLITGVIAAPAPRPDRLTMIAKKWRDQ